MNKESPLALGCLPDLLFGFDRWEMKENEAIEYYTHGIKGWDFQIIECPNLLLLPLNVVNWAWFDPLNFSFVISKMRRLNLLNAAEP